MLSCLALGTTFAADLEREIPVAADRRGNDLRVQVTRDGARKTATPTASVAGPTLRRVAERIERTAGVDLGGTDSGGTPGGSGGTPDEEEITARDAASLYRALRRAVKEMRSRGVPAPGSAPAATASPDNPPAPPGER